MNTLSEAISRRVAMVVIILAMLAIARAPWPIPVADQATTNCSRWIRRIEASGQAIIDCDPSREASAGARVGDTLGPRRTPAKTLIHLGLKLDINHESVQRLQAVPGIGPRLAERLVAARPFDSLRDLERVRGIGPIGRQRLSRYLRLSPRPLLWPSSPAPAASSRRKP